MRSESNYKPSLKWGVNTEMIGYIREKFSGKLTHRGRYVPLPYTCHSGHAGYRGGGEKLGVAGVTESERGRSLQEGAANTTRSGRD